MNNKLRISCLVLTVTLSHLATARPARASEEGALAYGFLAGELSMAGVFALNFGVDGWPNEGPAFALNFAPMVIGPGAGLAAHFLDLDPRPAYAMHGATVVGFDLFMMGLLIDGRGEQDGIRVGPTAWTLGAVGAAAGAVLGATQIGDKTEGSAFYAAPLAGFAGGGIVIGGLAALATKDSNKAFQRVVMGATGGLTLGIVGSLIFATSDGKEPRRSPRKSHPAVTATPETVMFSYGGIF